jgi:hypothetical protein
LFRSQTPLGQQVAFGVPGLQTTAGGARQTPFMQG